MPGSVTRRPRLRELDARQIDVVLSRNNLGRIAFPGDDGIDVLPIHFVYANGSLYLRTSMGGKYRSWMQRPEVAFEVDESDSVFDWRSVIVRGTLAPLQPQGPGAEQFEYWNAVQALQTVVPNAFGAEDIVPHRSAVFRIQPRTMTGRESRSV